MQAGLARWQNTCTKFNAWNLSRFKRLVFLDSDTLVVGHIDEVVINQKKEYSSATFAAAPETFPPDTFNAGFMVITPSKAAFDNVNRLNEEVGSTEGGDQGVLNNGLCPDWHNSVSLVEV